MFRPKFCSAAIFSAENKFGRKCFRPKTISAEKNFDQKLFRLKSFSVENFAVRIAEGGSNGGGPGGAEAPPGPSDER